MTDSHQQSYYELALTNRQVMVAFVVLLACIFVAFFSGIWIGRQEDSQHVLEASQQTVEAAADALDLGTLQFFSDSAADEPKAEPLKGQNSGTTLLEDLQSGKAKVETASAAPSAPPTTQPSAQSKTESVTKAAAERPAPDRETPAAVPPPAKVPTGDQLVIQVFSSADVTQAQGLKDRLTEAGLSAFISPVEVGGRTMHRVRIGPFDQRSEATNVADRVRRDFKLDTWITR